MPDNETETTELVALTKSVIINQEITVMYLYNFHIKSLHIMIVSHNEMYKI